MSSSSSKRLTLQIQIDGEHKHTVTLPQSATVLELKETLKANHTNVPAFLQRILYGGKDLDNNRTLYSYGIKDMHVIQVVTTTVTPPTTTTTSPPQRTRTPYSSSQNQNHTTTNPFFFPRQVTGQSVEPCPCCTPTIRWASVFPGITSILDRLEQDDTSLDNGPFFMDMHLVYDLTSVPGVQALIDNHVDYMQKFWVFLQQAREVIADHVEMVGPEALAAVDRILKKAEMEGFARHPRSFPIVADDKEDSDNDNGGNARGHEKRGKRARVGASSRDPMWRFYDEDDYYDSDEADAIQRFSGVTNLNSNDLFLMAAITLGVLSKRFLSLVLGDTELLNFSTNTTGGTTGTTPYTPSPHEKTNNNSNNKDKDIKGKDACPSSNAANTSQNTPATTSSTVAPSRFMLIAHMLTQVSSIPPSGSPAWCQFIKDTGTLSSHMMRVASASAELGCTLTCVGNGMITGSLSAMCAGPTWVRMAWHDPEDSNNEDEGYADDEEEGMRGGAGFVSSSNFLQRCNHTGRGPMRRILVPPPRRTHHRCTGRGGGGRGQPRRSGQPASSSGAATRTAEATVPAAAATTSTTPGAARSTTTTATGTAAANRNQKPSQNLLPSTSVSASITGAAPTATATNATASGGATRNSFGLSLDAIQSIRASINRRPPPPTASTTTNTDNATTNTVAAAAAGSGGGGAKKTSTSSGGGGGNNNNNNNTTSNRGGGGGSSQQGKTGGGIGTGGGSGKPSAGGNPPSDDDDDGDSSMPSPRPDSDDDDADDDDEYDTDDTDDDLHPLEDKTTSFSDDVPTQQQHQGTTAAAAAASKLPPPTEATLRTTFETMGFSASDSSEALEGIQDLTTALKTLLLTTMDTTPLFRHIQASIQLSLSQVLGTSDAMAMLPPRMQIAVEHLIEVEGCNTVMRGLQALWKNYIMQLRRENEAVRKWEPVIQALVDGGLSIDKTSFLDGMVAAGKKKDNSDNAHGAHDGASSGGNGNIKDKEEKKKEEDGKGKAAATISDKGKEQVDKPTATTTKQPKGMKGLALPPRKKAAASPTPAAVKPTTTTPAPAPAPSVSRATTSGGPVVARSASGASPSAAAGGPLAALSSGAGAGGLGGMMQTMLSNPAVMDMARSPAMQQMANSLLGGGGGGGGSGGLDMGSLLSGLLGGGGGGGRGGQRQISVEEALGAISNESERERWMKMLREDDGSGGGGGGELSEGYIQSGPPQAADQGALSGLL